MEHSHIIIDKDNHFIIDPKTRKISPANTAKNILMQYDHNSERITFEIPKFVNNHDMSLCDVIEINYTNTASDRSASNSDIYTIQDLDITDDGIMCFSWLISNSVTQLEGTLNFSICFKCVENGEVTYAWHSDIYSGINVYRDIHNGDTIIEIKSDAIEALKDNISSKIEANVSDYFSEHSEDFRGPKGDKGDGVYDDTQIRNDVNHVKEDISQLIKEVFYPTRIDISSIPKNTLYYIRNDGTIGGNETGSVLSFMRCEPNKTYVLSRKNTGKSFGIGYYNKEFSGFSEVKILGLNKRNDVLEVKTITSSDAMYLFFYYYDDDVADIVLERLDSNIERLDSKHTLEVNMERGSLSGANGGTSWSQDDHEKEERSMYSIKLNGARKLWVNNLPTTKYNIFRVAFYDKDFNFLQTKQFSVVDYIKLDITGAEYIRIYINRTEKSFTKSISLSFEGCLSTPEFVKNFKIHDDTEWVTFDVTDDMYTFGRLMLPPNYTIDGEKAPLILYMDGSGNTTDWNQDFESVKLPYIKYLRDEGFAVLLVFGWGNKYLRKYPACGMSYPYPVPTGIACIKKGIEWVCDRYNVDYDNIHVMSKSQGGQCATFFASNPIAPFKSIGMFAPVTDYLSMPMEGIYYQTRLAIAEDMDFTGEVDFFGSESFLTYSERGKAFFRENAEKVCGMNGAWTSLVGGNLSARIEDSLNYCEKFWTEQYWTDESKTDIYTHHDRSKIGTVPVKIWGASDDNNTPYLSMVEIVEQLKNGGCEAHMRTLPRGTGGHSCADVDGNFVDSVTTKLGIVHNHIPIGWIENVEWIRSKIPK